MQIFIFFIDTVNWEWIASKPRLAPESFETCEPTIYLNDICQELIDEFESKKRKPKKPVKKKPNVVVVKKQPRDDGPKITQFFKEKKNLLSIPSKYYILQCYTHPFSPP